MSHLHLAGVISLTASPLESICEQTEHPKRDLQNPETAKKPQTRLGFFSVKKHMVDLVFWVIFPKTPQMLGRNHILNYMWNFQ